MQLFEKYCNFLFLLFHSLTLPPPLKCHKMKNQIQTWCNFLCLSLDTWQSDSAFKVFLDILQEKLVVPWKRDMNRVIWKIERKFLVSFLFFFFKLIYTWSEEIFINNISPNPVMGILMFLQSHCMWNQWNSVINN